MERTLHRTEKAYKNMEAVAKTLEAISPNNAAYEVEDVYFDYGLNWMWTTICRRGYSECQILCPKEWEEIVNATSLVELTEVIDEIVNGKWFGDR